MLTAPFQGKPFSGMQECVQCGSSLSQTLELRLAKDAFPSVSEWSRVVVDADALVEGQEGRGVVAVIGEGSFRGVDTGTSWALGDLAGSAECLGC